MLYLNRIFVFCGILASVTLLYLTLCTMSIKSEFTVVSDAPGLKATVGEHTIYKWINHQDSAHTGDEYEFRTKCPNRDKPPKHMYVIRHTERLDFLYRWWQKGTFLQWTKRAFDKNGIKLLFI